MAVCFSHIISVLYAIISVLYSFLYRQNGLFWEDSSVLSVFFFFSCKNIKQHVTK